MFVRQLADCSEFTAGDGTALRELLNPDKHPVHCRYSLAHATLAAGHLSILHRLKTTEVYYILAGQGRMEIDGHSRAVTAGDTIYIPPSASQRIENTGTTPLEFLCIVDPAWRPEDEDVLA